MIKIPVMCAILLFGVAEAQDVVQPDQSPSSAQLQPPKVTKQVPASYPSEALNQRLSGLVELSVTITPDGSVSDIKVLKSAGSPLNQAAIEAVRQ